MNLFRNEKKYRGGRRWVKNLPLYRATLDPYVKITLQPLGIEHMTPVITNGGIDVDFTGDNNEFNFEIKGFPNIPEENKSLNYHLKVEVYDDDGAFERDEFIGSALLPLNDIQNTHNTPFVHVLDLQDETLTEFSGRIEVSTEFRPKPDNEVSVPADLKNSSSLNLNPELSTGPGMIHVGVFKASSLRDLQTRSQLFTLEVSLIILFCYFLSGILWMNKYEGYDIIDSVYFCVVSLLTVGYGDVVPKSQAGHIFIAFFDLTGIGLIAAALSKLTTWILNKKDRMAEEIKKAELSFEKKLFQVRMKAIHKAEKTRQVLTKITHSHQGNNERLHKSLSRPDAISISSANGLAPIDSNTLSPPVSPTTSPRLSTSSKPRPLHSYKSSRNIIRLLSEDHDLGYEHSPSCCTLFCQALKQPTAIAIEFFIAILAIGAIIYAFAEDRPWSEAFYFAVVSVTTIGYGDATFKSPGGRLFCIFWLLLGCISLGRVLSMVIDSKAQRIAEAAGERRIKRLLRRQLDYSQLDRDHKGKISKLDFLIYELTALGRCEEWQINEILKRFDALDIHGKGELKMEDFKYAQERQVQEVKDRILKSKGGNSGKGGTAKRESKKMQTPPLAQQAADPTELAMLSHSPSVASGTSTPLTSQPESDAV